MKRKRYETLTLNAIKAVERMLDLTNHVVPYSSFICSNVPCGECPFWKDKTDCHDLGSGKSRTHDEWVKWLMEDVEVHK